MNDIARKTMKYSFFSAAAIAIMSIARGGTGWAAGLLVAVLWSVVNFSIIMQLLEISILQRSPSRITAILFVKFPILYMAGYFVLAAKLFPVSGILTGLALTLIVFGAVTIWPRRT